MTLKAALQGINCVLVGSMKPQLLLPTWLAENKLISKEMAESAKIDVSHEKIALFHLGRTDFQVEEKRFVVSTSDQTWFESMRDLLVGILKINNEPITQMGLNFIAHCQISTIDKWHELGHKLAPKESWKNILNNTGMKSIYMEGDNPYTNSGKTHIKVEPSVRISHGVYFEVNNSFNFNNSKGEKSPTEILIKEFSSIQESAFEKMESIIKLVD